MINKSLRNAATLTDPESVTNSAVDPFESCCGETSAELTMKCAGEHASEHMSEHVSEHASESTAEPCRRRMRPEDRMPALLDAALAVFTRKGFGSATLNDVAEHAGVTKGCLYHYFDSKEQLLLTLMRERSRPAVDAQPTPPAPTATREEAITSIVRQIWTHFQDPGQLELTTLAITEVPKAPELARALFDECVAEGRSTLCEALEDVARGGSATNEDEAKLEATLIPYMIMGVALAQRLFRGIDPDAPAPEAIERAMIRMLAYGI